MAATVANASPSGCLRQPDRHGTIIDNDDFELEIAVAIASTCLMEAVKVLSSL